jgi:hypothetical protein
VRSLAASDALCFSGSVGGTQRRSRRERIQPTDFAEPVLGLADGTTRGLNPSNMRPLETAAIVLLIALFSPFPPPVIRLFNARAFSFDVSMTFPVFNAHRRHVNRLYFTGAF